MKAFLLILVLVSLCPVCPAQGTGQQAMTNKDVVELVKAQFAADTVIKKIQTAPAVNFDTSTGALVELKKAGVDEKIIVAMLERSGEIVTGRVDTAASPADVKGSVPTGNSKDAPAKKSNGSANDSAKRKSVRAASFTFELGKCVALADRVTCDLMITNDDSAEKGIGSTSGGNASTMIDDKGNEHRASESKIADRRDGGVMQLAPGIPVSAKVVFESLPELPATIKLLTLRFYAPSYKGPTENRGGFGSRGFNLKAEFRDIVLAQ